MPDAALTDGWAIATNSSRGTFSVGKRKFQIRGLTRRQKRELMGEQLNWEDDTAFLVWALTRLRVDGDAKDVGAELIDDMDDREVNELTERLMIHFGFKAPKAPDATAEV